MVAYKLIECVKTIRQFFHDQKLVRVCPELDQSACYGSTSTGYSLVDPEIVVIATISDL